MINNEHPSYNFYSILLVISHEWLLLLDIWEDIGHIIIYLISAGTKIPEISGSPSLLPVLEKCEFWEKPRETETCFIWSLAVAMAQVLINFA